MYKQREKNEILGDTTLIEHGEKNLWYFLWKGDLNEIEYKEIDKNVE